MAKFDQKVNNRLWAKIDKSNPDGCWNWTAAKDKNGYGLFGIGGKMFRVNRVILEEKLERPMSLNMYSCHTCDNPSCCNPAHIYEGTSLQNAQDREGRGRRPMPNGNKHWSTVISDEHVQFIRDVYPEGKYTMQEIADYFSVGKSQIWGILHNKTRVQTHN